MIHAVNPSLDYKNVLKLCVCGITNQNCMLHHCDLCPDESVIRDFLMQQLQNSNCSPSDLIKYKQWVSTDRSQLEDNEEDFDDFLAKPLSMLFQLTEHHFIAKSQSNFFKKEKDTLNQDECILVLDFAENYSFVIQDCAKGLHWNNLQAAIHPFVLYYVDLEKEIVCHKAFACSSLHISSSIDQGAYQTKVFFYQKNNLF